MKIGTIFCSEPADIAYGMIITAKLAIHVSSFIVYCLLPYCFIDPILKNVRENAVNHSSGAYDFYNKHKDCLYFSDGVVKYAAREGALRVFVPASSRCHDNLLSPDNAGFNR